MFTFTFPQKMVVQKQDFSKLTISPWILLAHFHSGSPQALEYIPNCKCLRSFKERFKANALPQFHSGISCCFFQQKVCYPLVSASWKNILQIYTWKTYMKIYFSKQNVNIHFTYLQTSSPMVTPSAALFLLRLGDVSTRPLPPLSH